MGARQSRRSVDITTTPKKEGAPAEGGVGDTTAPGDGKLERIEETDTKPTTNGIAPHTDVTEDKDKDKDDATEKEKDKEKEKEKEKDKEKQEDVKSEETKQESASESPSETAEATTPTEANPASPNTATSPESKETKKKEKMKKKWSFRSISFSKKDKSKPAREEAPKNGDVTKEEPLAEGGEEAENASATAGSPVEEKSAISSPSEEKEAAPASASAASATATATATATAAAAAAAASVESKEEVPAATAAASPADEKQEEPTPSAPTPVPVEEKKEEVEKVEAEEKAVEVSRAGGQSVPDPVEVSVFQVQTVATPSIIERKTSEDTPSLPPSSPPPTPIDPSPLQQAQQVAANATALAEALKLPAEAAEKDLIATPASSASSLERNDPSTPPAQSLDLSPQRPLSSSTDDPQTETTTPVPPKPEALPVVDTVKNNPEVAVKSVSQKAELEAPPASQTDARNIDAAPVEPEPVLFEKTEESVMEPPVEKVSSEQSCQIKAEETSLPASELVVEEAVKADTVCDVGSAPPPKDKAAETLAEEAAKEEEVIEVEEEQVAEPVTLSEHEDELLEEVVEEVVEEVEVVQEGAELAEEVVIDPPVSISDSYVESEEGPIPLSEDIIVVEAKPAVVILEDEEAIEEVVDTDADVSKVDTESVEVIPDVEDKLEGETESDVIAQEDVFVLEEPEEDTFPPNEEAMEYVEPVAEVITIVEEVSEKSAEEEEDAMPPPPEPLVPNPEEQLDSENIMVEDEPTTVPSPMVELECQEVEVERSAEDMERPASQTIEVEPVEDSLLLDCPVPPMDPPPHLFDTPVSEKEGCEATESHIRCSILERVSSPSGDLPPMPQAPETSQEVSENVDSTSEYPLPPEELSCPPMTSSNLSEMKNELAVSDENAPSLRNPTETLLTPPRSPSPQSNVSITSGLTTSTKDSSQTQFYDDQSNREFKTESVSISLNSYNESDIELKERLAESLAPTVNQEESSVSCQLSNNTTTSTIVQETHQSAPKVEAPVENNVAHDNSTTESSDETPKVAPPAVPVEVPANPPSAPAITEDVASVAKAIEEIDISDKAVAAATIECNTNEIIADAHYQNNINE